MWASRPRRQSLAEDDPDKLKGPGGLSMRQILEQTKKSMAHDRDAALKTRNALLQRNGRWQRFVRYVWDKKRG
ncbi:MAG: hypothetical protein EXR28_16790 [Betaproteobacteria bacterium]|nr:hypothetical protein [Betaproteobacteria bacterium]